MIIKKLFSYFKGRQIWRIQISEMDSLIIEERDIINKKVFFSCIDKITGKTNWADKKFLDEDFWIGIEAIYRDTLFLHLFEKPDMPKHKQIIAVDLNTAKVKWINKDLTFDSISNNKVLAYIQKFEGRDFFLIDYSTGDVIESLGSDSSSAEMFRQSVGDELGNNFLFPSFLTDEGKYTKLNQSVLKVIGDTKYFGKIEFIEYENLFLFNYYEKNHEASLTNWLCIFDLQSQTVLLKEILNSSSPAPVPDSFFIHGDLVYFVKDKKELVAYLLQK
ncbi:MAG: DUF4905 domain-containing protein [Ignavibacteria bacterium]|nr:DUF4905 domain-containing protein [Ignavibacteria bacterium]